MKRFRRDLLLFLTVSLICIMFFSIVQGTTSPIVQNEASMKPPYATGDHSSGGYGSSDGYTDSNANHDPSEGIIYAVADSLARSTYDNAEAYAWAEAYLGDAFEIVHSSNYNITFSFHYKGNVGASFNQWYGYGEASYKVTLRISLVDKNNGTTVFQVEDSITEFDETEPIEVTESKNIVITNKTLESNHIYDWKAILRTETACETWGWGTAEATANFFDKNKGYQVRVTQVLVEDLYPDFTPPTTISSPLGTVGENGWYNSNVEVSLSATDGSTPNSYGVNYTEYRISDAPWNRYSSPITISSEGTNKVDFYSVDKANNKEVPVKSVIIKIDKTSPTGSIVINDNALSTTSPLVTIKATANDANGVAQMRFSNDGSTWTSWEAYATSKAWSLTEGSGTKTVYFQSKDNAGLTSIVHNDTIILEAPSPTPKPTPSPTPSSTTTPTPTPEPTPTPTSTVAPDATSAPTNTPAPSPSPSSSPSNETIPEHESTELEKLIGVLIVLVFGIILIYLSLKS